MTNSIWVLFIDVDYILASIIQLVVIIEYKSIFFRDYFTVSHLSVYNLHIHYLKANCNVGKFREGLL